MDIQQVLFKDYEKILRINLRNGTFMEIKNNETINYSGIEQWFIEFANSNQIYEEDKCRFLAFANIVNIAESVDGSTVFYRRVKDGKFIWYVMAVYTTDNKDEVVLTVRNIDHSMKIVTALQGEKNSFTLSDLKERSNKESALGSTFGIIMVDHKDAIDFEGVLNYLYLVWNIYQYDNDHSIIVFSGRSHSEFYLELAKAYKELAHYNVHLGHSWKSESWDLREMIEESAANLQVNTEKIDF